MENTANEPKSRIYFVEKSMQARFILKYCIIVLLGGLLSIGIIYFLAMQSTTVFFENSRVVAKTTADFVLPILLRTVLIVTAFVIFATIAAALFVSRRVIDPLHRFKEVMNDLGEGDYLSDFKICELDELHDFSRAFEAMVKKMRAQVNMLKEASAALEKNLNNITESDVPEQKKQYLNELRSISTQLNQTVSRLKS